MNRRLFFLALLMIWAVTMQAKVRLSHLVSDNMVIQQQMCQIISASSGTADMLREVLRTTNNAWFVIDWHVHCLCAIELWILESCQTKQCCP